MSINIYQPDTGEKLAYLGEDVWELPGQLAILEKWLIENEHSLEPSSYIADIGFEVRKNAAGGGGTLSVRSLRILSNLGIKLYFSEYSS